MHISSEKLLETLGLYFWEVSVLKSVLINEDFQTWHLIGWQPAARQSEARFENPC